MRVLYFVLFYVFYFFYYVVRIHVYMYICTHDVHLLSMIMLSILS